MTTTNPTEQEQPFAYSPVEATRALLANHDFYAITTPLEIMDLIVDEMKTDEPSADKNLSYLSKSHPVGLFVLAANNHLIIREVPDEKIRLHLFRAAEISLNKANMAIAEYELRIVPDDPFQLNLVRKKVDALRTYQQQLTQRVTPTLPAMRK